MKLGLFKYIRGYQIGGGVEDQRQIQESDSYLTEHPEMIDWDKYYKYNPDEKDSRLKIDSAIQKQTGNRQEDVLDMLNRIADKTEIPLGILAVGCSAIGAYTCNPILLGAGAVAGMVSGGIDVVQTVQALRNKEYGAAVFNGIECILDALGVKAVGRLRLNKGMGPAQYSSYNYNLGVLGKPIPKVTKALLPITNRTKMYTEPLINTHILAADIIHNYSDAVAAEKVAAQLNK